MSTGPFASSYSFRLIYRIKERGAISGGEGRGTNNAVASRTKCFFLSPDAGGASLLLVGVPGPGPSIALLRPPHDIVVIDTAKTGLK